MSDTEDVNEANEPKDKHNWGAADLEKVNVYEEDKDDSKAIAGLGSLISEPQVEAKVVNVKKEDVQMMVHELELPQVRVQRLLIDHNGDVSAAIKSFMGV